MAKDAKLGLVLGIGVVIVVAVVFFRKDASQAKAATETAAVKPKSSLASPVLSDVRQPAERRYTVAEGDTLSGIALRYYEDRSKFVIIYEANQERIPHPERLEPGTVLLIPER